MFSETNFVYYSATIIFTLAVSLALAGRVIFSGSDFALSPNLKKRHIWLAAFLFFALFSFLTVLRYNAYNICMLDLGRMSQAIWNTGQARPLEGTFDFGNASRLIAHSEFIYFFIAPFYKLWPDPRLLLLIQVLVVSLGALPVFRLAKEKTADVGLAFCFSLAYLLCPSLQYPALLDFHPDMLAVTFLLFTFYYLEKNAWKKYFIFLVLSLLCKEYVALLAVGLGLYVLLRHKNLKVGSATFILGVFWLALGYFILPAMLSKGRPYVISEGYAHLGSTGGEAFRSILLRPQGLLLHFFSLRNLGNLILLFLPLGFLALLEPAMLAIAGPLLLGLLSSNCFFYNNHHTGTVIPVIFAAAIGAAGALISKFKIKFRNIAAGLAVFILINSMLCAVFYGPSPLSWRFWQRSSYRYWNTLHQFRVSAHDRIADRIMKMVPAQASLSVSNHLGAHLSNREVIYQFPHPQDLNQVDFIAVDILEYTPLIWLPRQQELKALNRVFKEGNFVLSFSEDGILLFARKQAGKQDEFRMGIEKIQSGIPAHEVNLPLGNRLLLLGFDLEKDYFFCGGKQRIVYYWQVLEGVRKKFRYAYFGLQDDLSGQYVLIDTLKQGKTQAHLVHLPLYLVLAAGDLKAGDILREEFDFYLPPDLNNGWYDWQTGLYVAPEFYSIRTQNEGLVPGTAEIDLGKIELKSKGR